MFVNPLLQRSFSRQGESGDTDTVHGRRQLTRNLRHYVCYVSEMWKDWVISTGLVLLTGCVGAKPQFDDAEQDGAGDEYTQGVSVTVRQVGPCACLTSREYPRRYDEIADVYSGGLVRGAVTDVSDSEVWFEVTELVDVLWNIELGDVIGGELHHLCPGGDAPSVGATVLAQFHYNDPDDSNCEAYRECVNDNCTPPGEQECGCYESHHLECGEAYKLEGRVTLLNERDGLVTYEWEGEDREAPLDQLLAQECETQHPKRADDAMAH